MADKASNSAATTSASKVIVSTTTSSYGMIIIIIVLLILSIAAYFLLVKKKKIKKIIKRKKLEEKSKKKKKNKGKEEDSEDKLKKTDKEEDSEDKVKKADNEEDDEDKVKKVDKEDDIDKENEDEETEKEKKVVKKCKNICDPGLKGEYCDEEVLPIEYDVIFKGKKLGNENCFEDAYQKCLGLNNCNGFSLNNNKFILFDLDSQIIKKKGIITFKKPRNMSIADSKYKLIQTRDPTLIEEIEETIKQELKDYAIDKGIDLAKNGFKKSKKVLKKLGSKLYKKFGKKMGGRISGKLKNKIINNIIDKNSKKIVMQFKKNVAKNVKKEATKKMLKKIINKKIKIATKATDKLLKKATKKVAKAKMEKEASKKVAKKAVQKKLKADLAKKAAKKLAKEAAEKKIKTDLAKKAAEKAAKEAADKAAKKKLQAKLAEKMVKEAAKKKTKDKAAKEAVKKLAKELARKKIEAQTSKKAAEKLAKEVAKKKAADKVAKEAVEKSAKESAKKETEAKAAKKAAEKAKKEAAEKARKEVAEKAKKEVLEKAKKEVAEKIKREVEEKARIEAVEKAKKEAAEKVKKEAIERANKEAARKKAVEKAKRKAAERIKRKAKEKAKKEAIEKAKKEAVEKAKKEAAEKARKIAAEKARKIAEKKTRANLRKQILKDAKDKAAKDVIKTFKKKLASEIANKKSEKLARKKGMKAAQKKLMEKTKQNLIKKLKNKFKKEALKKTAERKGQLKVKKEFQEKLLKKASNEAKKKVVKKSKDLAAKELLEKTTKKMNKINKINKKMFKGKNFSKKFMTVYNKSNKKAFKNGLKKFSSKARSYLKNSLRKIAPKLVKKLGNKFGKLGSKLIVRKAAKKAAFEAAKKGGNTAAQKAAAKVATKAAAKAGTIAAKSAAKAGMGPIGWALMAFDVLSLAFDLLGVGNFENKTPTSVYIENRNEAKKMHDDYLKSSAEDAKKNKYDLPIYPRIVGPLDKLDESKFNKELEKYEKNIYKIQKNIYIMEYIEKIPQKKLIKMIKKYSKSNPDLDYETTVMNFFIDSNNKLLFNEKIEEYIDDRFDKFLESPKYNVDFMKKMCYKNDGKWIIGSNFGKSETSSGNPSTCSYIDKKSCDNSYDWKLIRDEIDPVELKIPNEIQALKKKLEKSITIFNDLKKSEILNGNICKSLEECRSVSISRGLKLGGKGSEFKGPFKTKGCYTYIKGNKYHGRAYYGTGGNDQDKKKHVKLPKIRIKCYKGKDHSKILEKFTEYNSNIMLEKLKDANAIYLNILDFVKKMKYAGQYDTCEKENPKYVKKKKKDERLSAVDKIKAKNKAKKAGDKPTIPVPCLYELFEKFNDKLSELEDEIENYKVEIENEDDDFANKEIEKITILQDLSIGPEMYTIEKKAQGETYAQFYKTYPVKYKNKSKNIKINACLENAWAGSVRGSCELHQHKSGVGRQYYGCKYPSDSNSNCVLRYNYKKHVCEPTPAYCISFGEESKPRSKWKNSENLRECTVKDGQKVLEYIFGTAVTRFGKQLVCAGECCSNEDCIDKGLMELENSNPNKDWKESDVKKPVCDRSGLMKSNVKTGLKVITGVGTVSALKAKKGKNVCISKFGLGEPTGLRMCSKSSECKPGLRCGEKFKCTYALNSRSEGYHCYNDTDCKNAALVPGSIGSSCCLQKDGKKFACNKRTKLGPIYVCPEQFNLEAHANKTFEDIKNVSVGLYNEAADLGKEITEDLKKELGPHLREAEKLGKRLQDSKLSKDLAQNAYEIEKNLTNAAYYTYSAVDREYSRMKYELSKTPIGKEILKGEKMISDLGSSAFKESAKLIGESKLLLENASDWIKKDLDFITKINAVETSKEIGKFAENTFKDIKDLGKKFISDIENLKLISKNAMNLAKDIKKEADKLAKAAAKEFEKAAKKVEEGIKQVGKDIDKGIKNTGKAIEEEGKKTINTIKGWFS